jgi:hypothetical protein
VRERSIGILLIPQKIKSRPSTFSSWEKRDASKIHSFCQEQELPGRATLFQCHSAGIFLRKKIQLQHNKDSSRTA